MFQIFWGVSTIDKKISKYTRGAHDQSCAFYSRVPVQYTLGPAGYSLVYCASSERPPGNQVTKQGIQLPSLQHRFVANSKHRFTTSFLQPLPYLVTPEGPKKMSVNEQFFVGAQTVVSLLQTTQIKQGVSFIAANKVYTSTSKTTIK